VAQPPITDSDITKALLGKKTYEVSGALKDLGVWFHFHFMENRVDKGEEKYPKIYSIADSHGHAKVYLLRNTADQVIYEVMINFRHDDQAQVMDLEKISTPDEYHVGTYSTDVIYRLKK
jgi:putative heme degradation protein